MRRPAHQHSDSASRSHYVDSLGAHYIVYHRIGLASTNQLQCIQKSSVMVRLQPKRSVSRYREPQASQEIASTAPFEFALSTNGRVPHACPAVMIRNRVNIHPGQAWGTDDSVSSVRPAMTPCPSPSLGRDAGSWERSVGLSTKAGAPARDDHAPLRRLQRQRHPRRLRTQPRDRHRRQRRVG